MNIKSSIFGCVTVICIVLAAHIPSAMSQCAANGDVNNDGNSLTVADQLYLQRYLSGDEPTPPVLYQADMNGDCMIDYLDALVYEQFFIHGMSAFDPYGGYPVATCCDPDTTRGACCFLDSCALLSPPNCTGVYKGDGTPCDPNPCDTCDGQLPGDMNSDWAINVGDAVYLINYLEKGGPAPDPPYNGDPNGNCCIGYGDMALFMCTDEYGLLVDPVDCTCLEPPRCEEHCYPGDATGDSTCNVADAVYLVSHIFGGGPPPEPFAVLSGDANGDGTINVGDAVRIIAFVFSQGDPPIACGPWFSENPCLHPDGHWLYQPPPFR